MLQHGQYRDSPNGSGRAGIATMAAQTVMIVNGCFGVLELLETILDGGRYDVVFVESNDRAYSQIRRVRPDLVILCVPIDDLRGCHVLSMLKLDESTHDIPVLTHILAPHSEDAEDNVQEPLESGMLTPKRVQLMN